MIDPKELTSTEARLFAAYWQDGLLDLLAGGSLVLVGVGWLFGFPLVVAFVVPVALVLWPVARERITSPRLGQVRFSAARRHRMRHGLVAVASLGVLLFGFFALRARDGEPSDLVRWLAPGIPAFLLAALALSAAEALRLGRFVAYSVAFVAAGLGVAVLDGEPGWAILAGGLVVVASGARLLSTFLHTFPRLPTELEP